MSDAPRQSLWDGEAIKCLKPVAAAKAEVAVPFFANTLPLAIHYTLLTKATGTACLARLIEWGQQRKLFDRGSSPSSSVSTVPLICYGSAADFATLKEKDCYGHLVRVDITAYSPLYVFAQMHLAVRNSCEDILRASAGPASPRRGPDIRAASFPEVFPRLLDLFEYIEVFSEIPLQADALLKAEASRLPREPRRCRWAVVSDDALNNVVDLTHLQTSCARLFLWGGPMTSYFLDKPNRYIPLYVPPSDAAINETESETFKTVVIIRAQPSAQADLVAAVSAYHRRLFEEAARDAAARYPSSFRLMQYTYNRIARLRGHRSCFATSSDYADCIARHHTAIKALETSGA